MRINKVLDKSDRKSNGLKMGSNKGNNLCKYFHIRSRIKSINQNLANQKGNQGIKWKIESIL